MNNHFQLERIINNFDEGNNLNLREKSFLLKKSYFILPNFSVNFLKNKKNNFVIKGLNQILLRKRNFGITKIYITNIFVSVSIQK